MQAVSAQHWDSAKCRHDPAHFVTQGSFLMSLIMRRRIDFVGVVFFHVPCMDGAQPARARSTVYIDSLSESSSTGSCAPKRACHLTLDCEGSPKCVCRARLSSRRGREGGPPGAILGSSKL